MNTNTHTLNGLYSAQGLPILEFKHTHTLRNSPRSIRPRRIPIPPLHKGVTEATLSVVGFLESAGEGDRWAIVRAVLTHFKSDINTHTSGLYFVQTLPT